MLLLEALFGNYKLHLYKETKLMLVVFYFTYPNLSQDKDGVPSTAMTKSG